LETRNLIKFGKNSYVITLPSSWIKQNKLEKGDKVFVDVSNNSLVINPFSVEKDIENKKTVIHTDGKSKGTIYREIIGAYLNNSKTIEVKGGILREESEEIIDFLQALMSLEVVEQTSDLIVVRDFLNFNDISMKEIIKRVDNILRVMLEDCFNSFKEDYSESLEQRDKSINKFYFLLYRLIKAEFSNPISREEEMDLLTNFIIIESFEDMGDECKKIANGITKHRFDKKKKEIIIDYLNKMDNYYRDSMKSIYNNNKNLADIVSVKIREFLNDIDHFVDTEKDSSMVILINSIRNFVGDIRNICRTTQHNL